MKADAGEHVQASLPSLWAGRNEERKDKREHFEQEALSQTGSLYRYATWLVRDRALAEDVVQETLLKAWCSWHTYRPGSDIRAWLATILRHTFIRQRRKEQRELASIPFYDVERFSNGCGDPRTHRAAASHEDALDGELMRAVNALPRKFRQVVVLRHLKQLSVKGISQVTGTPIGTVKSRLFRAHALLRNRLYRYAAAAGFLRGRRERVHATDGRASGEANR